MPTRVGIALRNENGAALRPPSSNPDVGDLVDFFNHRALARIDQIRSVLAMYVAVFAQRRSLAIDRVGKLLELDGRRQALPAADYTLAALPVVV